MYIHAAVQIARDATIWASEFDARRVPPVCVKTGRPAEGTLPLWFSPPGAMYISPFGARRFRIPMTRGWLTNLTLLAVIRALALVIAVPCLVVSFFPNTAPGLEVIAYVALAISLTAEFVFWLARPRGSIHSTPEGQTWLLLVGVHPAFVDAVNRSRLPAAGLFSPDGKQFWDGQRWLNNDFSEQQWRGFCGRSTALPWWQITVGMAILWVAIGAIAWWSFHR